MALANRPVRRGQVVGPFGIGAMVDFPGDQSLMIVGLDEWPGAREDSAPDLLVKEERLQARLGVTHFRLPPDFREPGKGVQRPLQRLPAVRFPRWHYCPRCGMMEKVPAGEAGRVRCPAPPESDCSKLPDRRRPFVIPVRFAAACQAGHIQDFPFPEWAHGGAVPTSGTHRLRYMAGGATASLAGIRIQCTCKPEMGRSLAGSFDYDPESGSALSRVQVPCRGERPWLGEIDGRAHGCGEHLRTLQRGASNVYFPFTVSSIYVPPQDQLEDSGITRALEDPNVWSTLTAGLDEGRYIQAARAEVVADLRHLDPHKLLEAAQRKYDGVMRQKQEAARTDEEYRRAECEAFVSGRGSTDLDLLVEVRDASEYRGPVSPFLRRICLVHKLRETRAMAGFSRITPASGPDDSRLQSLSRSDLGWMPATVVKGEGVFLELNHEAVSSWTQTEDVLARARSIEDSYNRARVERGQGLRDVNPIFLLLHALAHVLVRQMSFDAGYGSASLRERIYAGGTDPEEISGLLIYTASGDSEGTLGGLVRLGEPGRLEQTLADGLAAAQWCSSDPVCIESTGQGADSANLAACHGCLLVSETSCEEGNRLLDRAMLVGTLRHPEVGFFGTGG